MHIHNAYEIYMHVSGELSYRVCNRVYSLRSGDIIICRPGELHFCEYKAPTVHEYRCVWFNLEFASELQCVFKDDNFNHKYSFNEEDAECISELFSSLYKSPVSKQKEIIFKLIAYILKGKKLAIRSVEQLSRQLLNIIDYIEKNYSTIRSTAEIAENNYISVSTLNRLFRKQLYMKPTDFLNQKRLSKAKELLDAGCSVTDACAASGYSGSSYFISLFRRRYGITPKRYSNMIKSSEN